MKDELRAWLQNNRAERDRYQTRADELDSDLTARVKMELDKRSATAAEIAEALGVSRARVYQIRDGRR